MDDDLKKEIDLFRINQLAHSKTKKRKDDGETSAGTEKKKFTPSAPSKSFDPKDAASAYKNIAAGSSYKFGVLTKIVNHLKEKFQEGEDHPLYLEEILDETNQLGAVTRKIRQWLLTEALPNNPKVEINLEGKYQFKPPLKCRDKKSLLRLLKQYDLKGLGGILRDDVIESVPQAERVLHLLDAEIITITRQDKKKVIFYNDHPNLNIAVEDDFIKEWRTIAVDRIDDEKIEDYLEKQGIRSMQDQGIKKMIQPIRRKANRKKVNKKPKDNEHMLGVLNNYDM